MRIQLQQLSNPSMNGGSNSLLPIRIHNHTHMAQINSGPDVFMMSAEHYKDRIECGCTNHANSAGEQGFTRNAHQLLRLAEAPASSGGKDDGGHRHPIQFSPRGEIELDLRVARLETETSRRRFL